MTPTITPIFGGDCCPTPSGTSLSGQIAQQYDVLTLELPTDASLVAVQIDDFGTGAIDFESTVDGMNWLPQAMAKQPTNETVFQATSDGIYIGIIAGKAAFRVIANQPYSGSPAVVTMRLSTAVVGLADNSPIAWTQSDVTLDGTTNQHLIEPNAGRRAFMLLNPPENESAVWSPVGADLAVASGIPLLPGAMPTVFTFPDCGVGLITVSGTAGNKITVYRGV